MRVKKVKAGQIKVGDIITAYWESGRYTRTLNGRVTAVRPLKQGGRDIQTSQGVREYDDDEPVEVALITWVRNHQ